jgi:acetyl esterase/lipase
MRAWLVPWLMVLCSACPSLDSFYRARDVVAASVDVEYIEGDHQHKHRLDLYRPRDPKERWPVVVFVHGGYWRGGDKTYWQAITGLYGNAGVALGELGIGTAVINYRLHPGASLKDMLDDVTNAMLWTRAHVAELGGDPDRIYLVGHSAGGHLVSLLGSDTSQLSRRGFDPEWLRGVVTVSGIYDVEKVSRMVEEEMRVGVFEPLFGKDYRGSSPATFFGPKMTPTLFIVGEDDYKSCIAVHNDAEQALRDVRGERAWFITIPGNKHEDMVLEMGTFRDEVAPAIAAFIQRVK